MSKSRIFFAALFAGFALSAVGFLVSPFSASASAAAGQPGVDLAADRIGAVFATLQDVPVDAAIAAAAIVAAKGDLEPAGVCAAATWPNIDASCLASDGASPRPVRMITVGYQSDANSTMLVRVPETEMAAR